ncbi:MAG: hypothetical protein IH831_00835 [Planctomycetes bacterium]|nr:hypothetical protein [Planctomycetota bacterium]
MNDKTLPDDNSQQLEEIVAYLDGELSPQESAQVERRLAADETYRQKLQSMERAWAALDELPAATVDDQFSKTTMELVVESARSEVEQQTRALPVQRRKQRLSTVLLATAAALLGALVFRLVWEHPNRALVADLPVIQYIDIYSQFRDVEFLRQLRQQLGDGHWALGPVTEELPDNFGQFRLVAAADKRATWLETLAVNERVTLRAKFNRFRSMSEEQQGRLRKLHQKIESAPDAAELQQTMLEYQQWLNGLPPSEQFELRKLPLEERVREVVSNVQEYDKSFDLTPEELQKLHRAVRPRWAKMRERAWDNFSRRGRGNIDSASVRGDPRRFPGRNSPEFQELIRAIREALPEEKREQFDQLTPPEQLQRSFGWMRRAERLKDVERRSGDRRRRTRVSEQELEEFFVEEVDAATKEKLLAMPRDEMQRRLRRMYDGKLPSRDWNMLGDEDGRDGRRPGPPRGVEQRRRDGPPSEEQPPG